VRRSRRALSRRDYGQLSARESGRGFVRRLWRRKELRVRQPFHDLPPAGQLMGLTDNDEVLSLITAIRMAIKPSKHPARAQSAQLAVQGGQSLPPPLSTRRTQVRSWLPLLICNIALQCHEQCLYFAQRVRTKA
jgi:hypothetical protein